jgi:CBS domain-containing protein/ribosome-associated translation inhibitor RaiA
MRVSEIAVDKVMTLNPEETVAKALQMMYRNHINQIPIADQDLKYLGMVYAREFIAVNAMPNSKLKGFLVKTPILSQNDSVEKCAQLIVMTGNHALPVIESGKLKGIVNEKDLVLTADLIHGSHAIVDEIMSGAIVIEGDNTLSNALSKMRRYNISRLPIIDNNGILIGIMSALDIAKVIATPRERATKSPGVGTMAAIRDIKIEDIMRRATSINRGTTLNNVIESFREADEITVTGDERPVGIVTPKDLLELTLPKQVTPEIHIAHLEDEEARREFEDQLTKFLKKIHGKVENIQLVIVYVDKHKTHKYSVRARLITDRGVVNARSVGYDPLSACKELISRLDRQIKSEHSQKVMDRQRSHSARMIT